jgi:hypothetical protein
MRSRAAYDWRRSGRGWRSRNENGNPVPVADVQAICFTAAAACLPLRSDLLGIRLGGGREPGGLSRDAAGNCAAGALSSFCTGGIRSSAPARAKTAPHRGVGDPGSRAAKGKSRARRSHETTALARDAEFEDAAPSAPNRHYGTETETWPSITTHNRNPAATAA